MYNGSSTSTGAINIPKFDRRTSVCDESPENGDSIVTKVDSGGANRVPQQRTGGRVVTTEEDVCSSQSSSSPRRNLVGFSVPQPPTMLSSIRHYRSEDEDEDDSEHIIDSDDSSWVRPYDHGTTRTEPIMPVSRDKPSEEVLDIATFPTEKLLEMLTALLDKIIKSNDRLASSNPTLNQERELMNNNNVYLNSVLSFRGKHIPQISLQHYFQRIQKYCPTTNDVFLSLLVYFDRISKRCNSNNNYTTNDNDLQYDMPAKQQQQTQQTQQQQAFVMDSHNIHRLLIAGVTVSTKFFSDFFYSNSRYARVGGISLQELNHLELQFLVLCDFELLISVNELQRYADLLYKFWHNSAMVETASPSGET